MRKTPVYDWEWLDNHTPFTKIFEKMCGMEITKEWVPYQVFGSIWSKNPHYSTKLKYTTYKNNFKEIKKQLLDTRVCRHNLEIYAWVNGMSDTTRDLCSLITGGCMVFESASFEWHWLDE